MIERIPVDPIGAGRDAWLALRANDVTASAAAALLGVHPYMTTLALWAEKTGRVPPDGEMTEAMERGIELEPLARRWIAKKNPTWRVEEPKAYFRDTEARLGATPDCFAVDPDRPGFGVVQIKNAEPSAFRKNWINADGDTEPPLYATVQAIVEASLTGATWAAVAALVIGHGIYLHIVEVPIHQGVIDRVKAATHQFWAMVAAGLEPPPDFGRDGEAIAAMFAEDYGTEINLSRNNRIPLILDEVREIAGSNRRNKKRRKELDAEVKFILGNHALGHLADGRMITHRLQRRKPFTVPASEFRVLRYPQGDDHDDE